MTLRQVTLPGGGSTITHPDGVTDDGWVRPADWLPMPTLIEGQQKLVLLVAVYPHEANFAAVQIASTSPGYTVDWGDGSTPVDSSTAGTSTTVTRNIAYADATALTSRGYRQVLVTVTPQAGANLTNVNLALRSPSTLPSNTSPQWLDVALVSSTVVSLTVSSGATPSRMVERFAYVGPSAITTTGSGRFVNASSLQRLEGTQWTAGITSFVSMFSTCSSLRAIPLLDTGAGTTFQNMFSACTSLRKVPLLNTASGTNFGGMFSSCIPLQEIPAFNTANGTDFISMFNACAALRSVPLLDTSKGVLFGSMFSGCSSLQAIPPLNAAAGTSFTTIFSNCTSLAVGALSGTRFTLSYSAGKLSASELNAIYTALGTAAGAQTITVSGNYGTTGDDPSIATAKGWTVTG